MSYPPAGPYQPQPAPGYGMPPAAPRKTSSTKIVLSIVAGVLGLCCVGGVAVAAFGGNDGVADAAADTSLAGTSAAGTSPAAGKAAAARTATTKAPAAQETTAAPAAQETTVAPVKKAAPGFGDAVRDGKFEFTVSTMDCSKSQVGGSYLNKKAQGKFCQINVKVKNIGKEAQYFDGSSQKAFDRDGTEFSNDGTAEIYANEDSATFLNEINPGNSAKGKLIFDVPDSTKLTSIELHDSMFSGGVTVELR
ncbi:DUF4352 domain-containing protein [Actinoplanes sp. NPDC051494]|uniref:DUF4352 domain-containing protein n=1 Tax=Actinoplanes sp. NPDC051494 TaxID=3363907 RepID=UPI003793A348